MEDAASCEVVPCGDHGSALRIDAHIDEIANELPDPITAAVIVARAAQGVGGALLVPGSLAIISAAFPADERGKAIGTWAGSRTGPRGLAGGHPVLTRDFLYQCADCPAHARLGILAPAREP
jgi:hypothetical protein